MTTLQHRRFGRAVRRMVAVVGLALALAGHAARGCAAADADDAPAAAEAPAAAPVATEEDASLLYADPFDEVVLDKDNNNAVLKVFPLDLPNRRVPKAPNATDEIEVRLKDRPDQMFKVAWQSIKRVRLFEQMLMDEAARMTAQGQFDAAYEYYELLENKYPKTTGVREAVDDYLWADSLDASKQERYDQALALLLELNRRNPKRPELAATLSNATGRLVEQSMKAKRYRAARGYLRSLATRYPDESTEVVSKYDAQLQKQAAALKAKAESLAKAGKTAQAWHAAAGMLDLWPGLPGGIELAKKIHAAHPTLVVAVAAQPPAETCKPGSARVLDPWPLRRTRRLLARELVEIRGAAETGGEYLAPWGTLERGQQLTLRLRSVAGSGRQPAATDLADALVRLSDPASDAFDPAFAEAFVRASIAGPDALSIELRSPVGAEGWLTGVLAALPAGEARDEIAPFRLVARSRAESSYTASSGYPFAEVGQPREIVERTFDDGASALAALRGGQVSVVARLNPWEVAAAEADAALHVEPYAFPTVHVLVPNRARPLTANRTFRRALEYAIDREGILSRALLGGRVAAGSQLVSGPLPRSAGDDTHGYGYEARVHPRPYDLPLARLLVATAVAESGQGAGAAHGNYLAGPLVLVLPAEPVARVAAQSIRRQLQAAGVEIQLREIAPGSEAGDDFDLAYAELPMTEPVVDVWRLFGPGALGGPASPYLDQALAELQAARDWKTVAERLQRIHQLVADEIDVLPLWQIVEHLAYRSGVSGIGERPVTLYDNIEQWKIELQVSAE